MIHPVVRLAAAQPMLLAAHVQAYADLASQALICRGADIRKRLAWQLVCVLCLAVAAVLAGVSALLWAAFPLQDAPALWMLFLTPLLPAVVAGWAWWLSCLPPQTEPFESLRQQLAADAALLGRGGEK